MVDVQSRHKFHLPEGLDHLMADITREVLLSQPDNIYGFIARYLAALLRAREALTIAADERESICACAGAPDLDNAINGDGTPSVQERSHSLQETSGNCLLQAVEHTGSEEKEDQFDDSHGVEPVKEDVHRQHHEQDLWSTSVFSLAGSCTNLPMSRPYSVHDSDVIEHQNQVLEELKPHYHRYPSSSSSDYELGNICIIVPQIVSEDDVVTPYSGPDNR